MKQMTQAAVARAMKLQDVMLQARFGVAPRCAESAHRQLQRGEDLDRVLTFCERLTLSKNLTLSYNNVIYQIKTKRVAYTMRLRARRSQRDQYRRNHVEYKGRLLEHSVREQEQQQSASRTGEAASVGRPARGGPAEEQTRPPPLSHPWRRFDFTENSMQARERRGELCILRK